MRAGPLLLALVCLAGFAAPLQARSLLADECNAYKVLADNKDVAKDLSGILKLLGLVFPSGLPADVTILLPNNKGLSDLFAPLGFSDTDTLLSAWTTFPEDITDRVISALLYHVIPGGVWTPKQLGEEGSVATALPDAELKFNKAGTEVTAAGNAKPAKIITSVKACGNSVLVVDQVLLPAELLSIPATPVDDALVLLLKSGAAGAPAPAPAPATAKAAAAPAPVAAKSG